MLISILALAYHLKPLVFLYQDLNVLLKDSIKLLEIYGKPSVTIDFGESNVLACLNKENAHSDSPDLFRFHDVTNLASESM